MSVCWHLLNTMKKNLCIILVFNVIVSGCAWFGGNNTSSRKLTKTNIPKIPQSQKPGGIGDNWRYIGTTNDNSMIDEINVNSISSGVSSDNAQIFNFEDRKTVTAPNKFAYPTNEPRFKYLISSWQINCSTQEYLMRTTTLYNDTGTKLTAYDYTNNSNIKWLKLGNGSFAQMQYNFICLNINRDLGY